MEVIPETVRDENGQPFDGTRDGVEYVYGVAVDHELQSALINAEQCMKLIDNHLSRPRNRLDTTDEWLAIFCDLERQMRKIRTLLGDQTDLYPEWRKAEQQRDQLLKALGALEAQVELETDQPARSVRMEAALVQAYEALTQAQNQPPQELPDQAQITKQGSKTDDQ
jgi:hypothetical protein